MSDKKQEKVLHTRVSKDLFEKVSTKARKHRVSTSNLIRNLVEDYIEIHGDVWDAIDNKLRNYLDKGDDSIIGYQSIILNKNTTCAFCDKQLKVGAQVYIGFFEKSSQKIVICEDCKEKEKPEQKANPKV